MEYNVSILDEVKFGDQIKDNKLSFLKNGNPIVIKALNGSEYWVTIDQENNLNYISTNFVDLDRLKDIGLIDEDLEELKQGKSIELYIKNEKYEITIDLSQKDNLKILKPINFYNIDKMYSNPELFKYDNYSKIESEKELFKILDSYEKLPFGEFSYNDVDKVINETKEKGYIVQFKLEDGADIISIKKQTSLDEIKIEQSIIKFIENNPAEENILFFIDKRDLNIYTIDGIRNDGKMYFSNSNNPELSYNYYEGKSFNLDNLKNGSFNELLFFNKNGDSVKNVQDYYHMIRVFDEFDELKSNAIKKNYFQFDYNLLITKQDLDLAGGNKELVAINRFIDYMPDSIENKILSRFEKEELFRSINDKDGNYGISNWSEQKVKIYRFDENNILVADVYKLDKTDNSIWNRDQKIDSYKLSFDSMKLTEKKQLIDNNQISNTMNNHGIKDEIIIIVATNEQIKQYQKYLELIDNDKNQNLEKNIPVFSKEQIESIPGSFYFDNSKINLTDDEKKSLILKKTIGLTDNKGYFVEISVDKNNRLKISRGSDFTNDYKILTKEDLTEKKELIDNNQISNTMANEKLSANDIDVKGAKTAEDKPVITYKEGDPVLVKEGDLTLVGIIKDAKDGNLTIDVRNNKEIKETKANEKDVEPLFYVNKEDQKIWLKFSYKEISRALNNTNGIKVKLENNQVMGLMAGEKSKVMPYQVEIDGKLANVEGRVFLRRNAEGNPYVAHDVKHKELNLDLPVYGVKLNDEQKQTLIQKGELGLVSGFKSGDKDFSLWVGLDKELNKVVTKRENDVYIDKVYGVQLSEMQKNELKKGNGVEIKDKNLFIKVSAAGTSSNSLGVYKTEKAIELGLMKKVEEKKNGRGTGMKM